MGKYKVAPAVASKRFQGSGSMKMPIKPNYTYRDTYKILFFFPLIFIHAVQQSHLCPYTWRQRNFYSVKWSRHGHSTPDPHYTHTATPCTQIVCLFMKQGRAWMSLQRRHVALAGTRVNIGVKARCWPAHVKGLRGVWVLCVCGSRRRWKAENQRGVWL